MLKDLRYKISAKLMKKADELIKTGEFENIIKGLKLVKRSVQIAPPSKELADFQQKMGDLARKYS